MKPTLAIICADLGQQPMRFAAATRAAETDSERTIGLVALPGRCGGGELFGLEEDAGAGEVCELIARAAGVQGVRQRGTEE